MAGPEAPERADPASPSAPHAALAWWMAGLAAAWILVATSPPRSYGDTLYSRLATVFALSHEDTWVIDVPGEPLENPFADKTVDKVEIDGRIYSSKPPVLPLLMTAEYVVMRATTGWSLDDPDDLAPITRVITFTLIGLPFLAMVWVFTRTVQLLGAGTLQAAFLALASIIGTQAGAYATIFNNHVPAAVAVIVCFYICIRIERDPQFARPRTFALFGLAAGVAATVDIPVTIFPALLSLALARRHFKSLLYYAAPVGLALIAVQSWALYDSTGSPLPAQLRPEAYLFENSHWRNPLGVDALNDPPAVYLFHITFGRVGVFSLFPIALLAIPGFVLWMRKPPASVWMAGAAVAGTLVLAAYYALTTNNYGGAAFGFRWFIVLGPLFLLLSTPAVQRITRRWVWAVVILLLCVSFVSMLQCARRPWNANQEWTTRIFGPSV